MAFHDTFHFDRTVLPDMERQLPDDIRRSFAIISCVKHTPDKQVYVMADRSSGDRFLLKCASGEKAALLATEAEFLKNKTFPFLPSYHSCMREGDSFYLIREYIEGETLEDYVERQEMLPVKEALSILYTITGFIETLHTQDPPILHRDIKPQNFLMAEDGRLMMLDVETVRAYDPSADHDTMVVGTRSLAAPEQFGYSQTNVQSDIYGLGMLFLYLTTGDYSRKKQRYAFLPHSMRHIIEKCTSFDPAGRYGSIRALRRDILFIRRFRMRAVPFCALLSAVVLILGVSTGLLVHFRQNDKPLDAAQHITAPSSTEQPSTEQQSTEPQSTDQQSTENSSRAVQFANPYIEAAARKALHRSDSDPITPEELSGIHSLLLVGEETFTDWNSYEDYHATKWFLYADLATPQEEFPLEDLRYFTGLRTLALDVCNITDLSPLQDLPLERLSLRKSNITDISALAGISGLRVLRLTDNPLVDISATAELTALEELDISNTSVSDISMLSGSALRTLSCPYTGVADYGCLTSMPELTGLRVSHATEEDIALFNTLTGLELLTLHESALQSLNDIRGLTRLTSLDVSGCRDITSLEGITAFPGLDYLGIGSTDISDLAPAAELVKLTSLEFSYAPIDSFAPLADCRRLKQIYLNQVMADELERQLPEHSYELIIIDP